MVTNAIAVGSNNSATTPKSWPSSLVGSIPRLSSSLWTRIKNSRKNLARNRYRIVSDSFTLSRSIRISFNTDEKKAAIDKALVSTKTER